MALDRYLLFSRLLAWMAAAISLLVVCGWIFDIPLLTQFMPGKIAMKCNTAAATLALSLAALLPQSAGESRLRRATAAALAGFALFVALLTALEYLLGRNFGIDNLLVTELPGAFATEHPGRMAPLSILGLGLAAVSLLVFRRSRHVASALNVAGGTMGLVILMGYTFGARHLYTGGFSTNVSIPAGAALLLLNASLLLLGSASLLRSPFAGGLMFRRLLPVVIVGPWLIGWASILGARAGWYEPAIDQAFCVAPLTVLLVVVIVVNARRLDRVDCERQAKAEELTNLNRELERRVSDRTLELADANTSLLRLNRELEMLRRCSRALVRATEETELLQTVCEIGIEVGGYVLAWVGFAEQDERKSVRIAARSGPAVAYLDEITVSWAENDPFGGGPTGQTIRTGRAYVCGDTATASEFQPWLQAATRYGIHCSIGLPLRSADGAAFGALLLYGPRPDAFDPHEIDLLQELADDLAFGILGLRAQCQYAAAQLAVAAERQKFHTILEVLPPYLLLLTPDYHVAFANREFRRRFGEHEGRRCFEFLFGRTAPCETCETFEVLATGAPHAWEWTGPDGCNYEVHDFPFTDTDGTQLILEMGLDVTERKQAEIKLVDNQFYVRSLIESSLDAMMTTDPAGTITDVNTQMERLTGRPRAELVGAAFRQFCIEPQLAQEGIELVLRDGKVTDYELTVRAADGRETPVSYNANTFQDASGKLQGVFAAARDITERKQAERAMALSENRYRSLVTATAQVVWGTSPEGTVQDMPMWRALTGQSPDEVRGSGWLQALHPEDRAPTAAIWRRAVAARSLYDTEYRVRRHDGAYRHMAARGVPVLQEDGTVREWIGTCTDITGRKRAEEEIRQLNAELENRVALRTAELEAANQEMEAFTYSVSHDLRAPLRHLDGFSRLLLEEYGPGLEPGAVDHLNRIRQAAVRLGHLIDDLLQFSRLGRHALQPQIAGLPAIVRETIAELASECEGREIEWRVGDLPFLECDPALIRQVYVNLLSNAVKFTRPRSRAVIEIGQCERDGQTALFVADNGVGFSMKYADKLFGVFQRLHRAEDFEGTGVGLATVKRIVQKHGGRIWAEAELDRGANFLFTLSPPDSAASGAVTELAATGRK